MTIALLKQEIENIQIGITTKTQPVNDLKDHYQESMNNYDVLRKSIEANKKILRDLEENVSNIEFRQRQPENKERQMLLQKERDGAFTQQELQKLLILDLQNKLEPIAATYLEAKTNYETANQELQRARNVLEQKQQELNKLENIEAQEQLEVKKREELAKQKDKRQVIAENAIKQLDAYLTERNNRIALKVKDKLIPADKLDREAKITDLKVKLNSFVTLDNSEEMCELFNSTVAQFKGLHFRNALNKIILNFCPQTPEHSMPPVEQPEHFSILYDRISEMHQYGEQLKTAKERDAVCELADQLRKDVDHFLVTPNFDKKTFHTKMTARLHSEDVLMSRYEGWRSVVANIARVLSNLFEKQNMATYSEQRFFTTGKGKNVHKVQEALDTMMKHIPSNNQ